MKHSGHRVKLRWKSFYFNPIHKQMIQIFETNKRNYGLVFVKGNFANDVICFCVCISRSGAYMSQMARHSMSVVPQVLIKSVQYFHHKGRPLIAQVLLGPV